MIVTKQGNHYAFSFHSIAEIAAYNEWVEETRISGAKVPLPIGATARTIRKASTKSPSILMVLDEEARQALEARWML